MHETSSCSAEESTQGDLFNGSSHTFCPLFSIFGLSTCPPPAHLHPFCPLFFCYSPREVIKPTVECLGYRVSAKGKEELWCALSTGVVQVWWSRCFLLQLFPTHSLCHSPIFAPALILLKLYIFPLQLLILLSLL